MLDHKFIAAAVLNTMALDLDGNCEKILKICRQAAKLGIKLAVFPELSLCGCNCGDMFGMPELIKAAEKALLELRSKLPDGLVAGVGTALEGADGNVYDAYVLLERGRILGIGASSFCDNQDWRSRCFSAVSDLKPKLCVGKELYSVENHFNLFDCKVGIYFNRADLEKVKNCNLVLCPRVSRFELAAFKGKERELARLSKELGALLVSTNLSGCESGSDIYDGSALIIDRGEVKAKAPLLPFARTSLLTLDCGVASELEEHDEILRAVGLGLFDWMVKTRSRGFALSMSGGADSGLCSVCVCYSQLAALCELGFDEYKKIMASLGFSVPDFAGDAETYIKERMMPQVLTTVYQGSAISGSITRTAALKVAQNVGATHFEWSIADLVKQYVALIDGTTPCDPLNWGRDDLTLQNIQARSRAPGIWMIANRYNKLLMSTCNASEDAVGYCTMDGDTAGGVSPLGDISKSRILKINAHIAKDGVKIAPQGPVLHVPDMSYIVAQAPTAELKPGQTDERDLMPYVVLDRIHELHQGKRLSPCEIVKTLSAEFAEFSYDDLSSFVKRYFTRLARNQWKRERGAATFHVEPNDLNAKTGFLFPLLNDGYASLLKDLK